MNRKTLGFITFGIGIIAFAAYQLSSGHRGSVADREAFAPASASGTSASLSDPQTSGKTPAKNDQALSVELPPKASADQLPANVRAYIDENFQDPHEKVLVGEIAAAQLDQLSRGSRSRRAAVEAFERSSSANTCLELSRGITFSGDPKDYASDEKISNEVYRIVNKVTSLIVHDKASMRAYLEFRENLSGQTSRFETSPNCAH